MPAKEHDNTSSYDVEASPLLSEDTSKSFAGQSSLRASHGGSTGHLHDLLLLDCGDEVISRRKSSVG